MKSIPRIELMHGTSEGSSLSKSTSLDSERLSPTVLCFTTAPVGDIVVRGPTIAAWNDVASGTAHTRRSRHENGEIHDTDGQQMSARRPLFDTFSRNIRDAGGNSARVSISDEKTGPPRSAGKWDEEQKSAINLNAPATVLIGSGRVISGSSRVQCLERANVGDFFRVWSVNVKFVLLTAHEGIDNHWNFLSQLFAGQALFFQVRLRVVSCDWYIRIRCTDSVVWVIRVRIALWCFSWLFQSII